MLKILPGALASRAESSVGFAGQSRFVPRFADFGAICRRAILGSELGGARRRVDYRPNYDGDRTGYWDAAQLTRAVSLLLREAVRSVSGDARVELRWRVYRDEAVVRIRYPRPLDPEDRLVSFFDGDEGEGPARAALREARDIVHRHGGTLARVRTLRGTTWVVSVPRDARPGSRADAAGSRALREIAIAAT